MKFFHIGDLHFGKMLHNMPLTETDQAFWTEQFLHAVDEYQVDAVVIAGDIYDRRVPPQEAMQLFDHLLCSLATRGKYVFVIPGNHDSAVRLSHVSSLLAQSRIYIAGQLQRSLLHVTVPDAGTDVTFWLMPYIFPRAVADRSVSDREEISSYDEAARTLLSMQEMDDSACNVLVAHQNVLAHGVRPEHSESETIIGGIGEIDFTAFDAFEYVALGHIHKASAFCTACSGRRERWRSCWRREIALRRRIRTMSSVFSKTGMFPRVPWNSSGKFMVTAWSM